jgi:hypothetical protein
MNFIRKLFSKIGFHRSSKIIPINTPLIESPQPPIKTECSICFESSATYCTTNCGHHYHKDCLKESLRYNTKCPNCRGQITHYSYKKKQISVIPESRRNSNLNENNTRPKRLFTQIVDNIFDYCTSFNIQPYFERLVYIRIPLFSSLFHCLYSYSFPFRIICDAIMFSLLIVAVYLYVVFAIIIISIYGIIYSFAMFYDFIVFSV